MTRPVRKTGKRSGSRSHPRLAALRRAGTRHVYADSADIEEMREKLAWDDGTLPEEIDGNTVNQPLVHKVLDRTLRSSRPADWIAAAWDAGVGDVKDEAFRVYTALCVRIGRVVVEHWGGRPWETSLQLHMGLVDRPDVAKVVARIIHRAVPGAIVKVPFAPHAPEMLLLARDLENEGIPVNFTSTFSARQAVIAALVANPARTNIFMGRLDQGLDTEGLGEHVDIEAQRHLRRLRAEEGLRTELIVASIRDRQTFERTAGCDVFTAPCEALGGFLRSEEIDESSIRDRVEEGGSPPEAPEGVRSVLGEDGFARLWRVEPELVEFLRELRREPPPPDGDGLFARFDRAGFGDVFHAPDEAGWSEIRKGKLPDLDGRLIRNIPIDTLYSLLADADFAAHQTEMDETIRGA